jgi:tetratricopeptide (TPR) repeat protein
MNKEAIQYLTEGKKNLNEGKLKAAEKQFSKFCCEEPESIVGLMLWASSLGLMKKYIGAEEKLLQALKVCQSSAIECQIRCNLASIYILSNKIEKAYQQYQLSVAIASTKDKPLLLIKWATVLYEQQQYDESLLRLSDALQLAPENPTIYQMMSQIFAHKLQPAKSYEILQQGIKACEPSSTLYFYAGTACLLNAKYEDALLHLLKSKMLGRKGYRVEYSIATAYLKMGKIQEAEKHYEEAKKDKECDIEAVAMALEECRIEKSNVKITATEIPAQ